MKYSIDKWTAQDYTDLIEHLKSIADENYRSFHSSLVPDKDNILGVRMPLLRALGKEISKGDTGSYYALCGTDYYEEVMLKGIVIGNEKVDYSTFINLVDNFAQLIDNWAVCDCFCSGLKLCRNYKEDFFEYIEKYLYSGDTWQIRLALVIMLDYYIDEDYIGAVLDRCESIKSDKYYVSMAQAWLVSIAYIHFPEKTSIYLDTCSLSSDTYRRAIQKICDSHRVTPQQKAELRKKAKQRIYGQNKSSK